MSKALQDFVEKINYSIAQEVEKRLAATMPVDWQSMFNDLLAERDSLKNLNEKLTKQIEELRKNKTESEPAHRKLIAWVHKDAFNPNITSIGYAAYYSLENEGLIGNNYVRASWLDQEFLEDLSSRDVK